MKSIEKIIDRQMLRWETARAREREEGHAAPSPARSGANTVITISRECGASGEAIAELVAERLGYEVFDQRIVDHISAATGVRQQIIEYIEDRRRSAFLLWVDGLIRQRWVTSSEYVKSLIQVLGSIAELGRVVILGRGASFVFGPEMGLHVRIVAPLDVRVERVARERAVGVDESRRYVEEIDDSRRRFVRDQFSADWTDPHAYHLVINTGTVDAREAAELILRLLEGRSNRGKEQ